MLNYDSFLPLIFLYPRLRSFSMIRQYCLCACSLQSCLLKDFVIFHFLAVASQPHAQKIPDFVWAEHPVGSTITQRVAAFVLVSLYSWSSWSSAKIERSTTQAFQKAWRKCCLELWFGNHVRSFAKYFLYAFFFVESFEKWIKILECCVNELFAPALWVRLDAKTPD